ncbi:pq loop repeat [Trichoderma cornu-damae]|uniref:Pq loop repeat n=1 Tax=Trichoderma cornu-damae TaxID=654480 RepID=A0A9P8QGE0_9HYPO|nr:pq loop repeat [Trichoderma cornu-damae]
MAPPTQTFNLDVEAISGICGSISIACWVVVFSPQIIQNFQRSSADALSIQFIIAWLLGDVFNILGAVLQGVLPTMIILAIYYTIADLVLLAQLFYYRGFTWRDEPIPSPPKTNGNASASAEAAAEVDEYSALIARVEQHGHHGHRGRRGSDWSGFSPAVPHLPEPPSTPQPPPTALQTVAWNSVVITMVCAAGVAGWFLGERASGGDKPPAEGGDNSLEFNTLGQVFGYICAALYIASRLPQLILNWRRKTTEGLSMLFFLFACLGNVTYVLSIIVYEPRCGKEACEPHEARRLYGRYMLVNLSWLAGSAITLLMDFGVFAQYFMYRIEDDVTDDEDRTGDEQSAIDDSWDHRPLLDRGD